jgi:hypothetical protein
MTTFKTALLAFTVACGVAVSAHAAEIATGKNLIEMKGDFVDGDAAKFEAAIGKMPRDGSTLVIFDYNHGGHLADGIRIGTAIHDARARTAVFNYCYSACATAWLGGSARVIVGDAQVGFHAASKDDKISGPANAAMGFYVAKLGLDEKIALWATVAGPDQVNVVTPELAELIHLPTRFLPPTPALITEGTHNDLSPQPFWVWPSRADHRRDG